MKIASLKEAVSAEEWKLRVDLAAAYRLVAAYGWSDLVFTHSSARIPGPAHAFLIDPYGLVFDEITASSLVLVDQQCNKLRESPSPVNPAGFTLHSCIHEARDDACCILHTHSRAGVAVSAKGGCAAAGPANAVCRRRRVQSARRRALRRRRPAGAGTTVPLHHSDCELAARSLESWLADCRSEQHQSKSLNTECSCSCCRFPFTLSLPLFHAVTDS